MKTIIKITSQTFLLIPILFLLSCSKKEDDPVTDPVPIDQETLNKSYKALTSALLTIDKRVLISIANSVWTEDDFEVKKAFIDVLTSYYDAESKAFDIGDPSAPGLNSGWIIRFCISSGKHPPIQYYSREG
ncbi:MAG: serpin family protein [Bacteroidales bacterium]